MQESKDRLTAEERFMAGVFGGRVGNELRFSLSEDQMKRIIDLLGKTPQAQEIIKKHGEADWLNRLLKEGN